MIGDCKSISCRSAMAKGRRSDGAISPMADQPHRHDRLAAESEWSEPGEIHVAVETPHGPIVEALLERGFNVRASLTSLLRLLAPKIAGRRDVYASPRALLPGANTTHGAQSSGPRPMQSLASQSSHRLSRAARWPVSSDLILPSSMRTPATHELPPLLIALGKGELDRPSHPRPLSRV